MTQTHASLPPSAYLILQRDRHILLILRPDNNRYGGNYDLPGDRSHGAEANTAVAARAARTELGIDVDPADLEFAVLTHGRYPDGKEHYNYYFRTRRWSGEPHLASADVGVSLEWFDLDRLPDRLTAWTQLGLEVARGGIPYVEYGFDQPA